MQKFLYRYDPKNPWAHRKNEPPSATSVERGTHRRRSKMTKVYLVKKRKFRIRRNAPFINIEGTSMECCTKSCLSGITRAEIQFIRRRVYSQDYQSQNYTIWSNIQVRVLLNGRSRIIYTVPNVGTVCKTAFKKVYAISDKKILLLLKKESVGDPTLQQDLRGRHTNNARRLLPSIVDLVISFIKNYNPTPSHYRRKTTSKLYFDSKYSLNGMWKDFIHKFPNIKSNRLKTTNKVICYYEIYNLGVGAVGVGGWCRIGFILFSFIVFVVYVTDGHVLQFCLFCKVV